jgi:hypothetical protein
MTASATPALGMDAHILRSSVQTLKTPPSQEMAMHAQEVVGWVFTVAYFASYEFNAQPLFR